MKETNQAENTQHPAHGHGANAAAEPQHQPSSLLSLLPIVFLVAMLVCTVHAFGSDSLAGASQVTLITAAAFCVLLGMLVVKVPWQHFENAIARSISSIATILVLLLLIGAIGGTWMVSGVVPTLICYGVNLIHPSVLLASTCVICAVVSVTTGSSWTTIATIGIAMMGIGRAQGFDDGWIAGAIISGAYFGDKISPLSDTTTIASGSLDVPLFKHIRYMMLTTVPSLIITLLIFAVGGLAKEPQSINEMQMFTDALRERFTITPWLLLVPVITGIMIWKRLPSLITLAVSSALGVLFAIIFQPEALQEIDPNTYRAALKSIYGATALTSPNEMVASLVSTRGMAGMMDTIWLIICAMCFGATMQASGMVAGITRIFVRLVRGRTSMVAATACTGVMTNVAIADQYLCILLTGSLFRDVYDRMGFERRLLSRTVEDSATVTSVLVPWNTCGMTQATVLGVATFTYLPYCFFNIISPLMSITIAALGYRIYRHKPADEQQ